MCNSPSNPKYSWSMLCSSLKPGHFFHIVPIFSPMLETTCRVKYQRYCMKYTCRGTFLYLGLLKHYYLELLAGEAAAWTARALDSDGRCSLCVTNFQERGKHAPPESRVSQHTTTLQISLHNHAVSNLADTLASTSHAGAAQPWCLVDHIFSCHDSAAPKPLFAWCWRSSN